MFVSERRHEFWSRDDWARWRAAGSPELPERHRLGAQPEDKVHQFNPNAVPAATLIPSGFGLHEKPGDRPTTNAEIILKHYGIR